MEIPAEPVTVDNQQWKEEKDDGLVVFRTCGSPIEFGLIRGVLESNDIPCFFFDRDYRGHATIAAPASRVQDAERALEEAQRLGGQMPGDP